MNFHINNYINPVIVLFGASKSGVTALEFLRKKKIKVDFFCDNDPSKWGQMLLNIVVQPPDFLELLNKDNTTIFITSFHYKEIGNQLRQMGFKNIYDMQSVMYYNQNEESINRLLNILEDEKSKEVADKVIISKIMMDTSILTAVGEDNQYFSKDIIKLSHNEVFVDGGAYDGGTVLDFINETKNNFKKVYSFEPEQTNFSILNTNLNKLNDSRIELINKGLWKETTKIGFYNSKNKVDSKIDINGQEIIESLSLDDFIDAEKITFIKMDIEGAELEALIGARKVITDQKPKLAVCVYHSKSHLWEIPLYIKNLVPDYKIYLRHHSTLTEFETLCYAI